MAWYVPFLIYVARICDVSIGTIRIITVIRGWKLIAAMLGFCEVIIWLYAVSNVISYINQSLWAVVAYGAGFATGTLVGMIIEERLAIGTQMIRIVNTTSTLNVAEFLRERNLMVTQVNASGATGEHELCFLVVPRRKTQQLINAVKTYCPRAFITVEDVRSISHGRPSSLFGGPASRAPRWRRLIKF